MRRYNLYLPENQLETLEKLSESGITVSEQIRIAIDTYIKKLERASFSESKSRKEDK